MNLNISSPAEGDPREVSISLASQPAGVLETVNPEGYVSLAVLARNVLSGWLMICLCGVAGLLLALGYLSLTPATYEISAVVAPVGDLTGAADSASSGPTVAAGALALIGVTGRPAQVSRIDRFLMLLKSVRVAERLDAETHIMRSIFTRDWDKSNQTWSEPAPNLFDTIGRPLRRLLGRPQWTAPSTYDLAKYLETNINVGLTVPERSLPVYRLTIDSSDPLFALNLLSNLIRDSDNVVREIDSESSKRHMDYIVQQLGTVTNFEHRQALINLLTEQERTLMLAAPNQPYAVDLLEPVHASSRPTKPQVSILVTLGLILGVTAGVCFTVLREIFRAKGH